MFGLGIGELLLILALVLVFFGASKLPQLGSGLGQGIRSFRKAFRDAQDDDALPPPPPPPPAARPGGDPGQGQPRP